MKLKNSFLSLLLLILMVLISFTSCGSADDQYNDITGANIDFKGVWTTSNLTYDYNNDLVSGVIQISFDGTDLQISMPNGGVSKKHPYTRVGNVLTVSDPYPDYDEAHSYLRDVLVSLSFSQGTFSANDLGKLTFLKGIPDYIRFEKISNTPANWPEKEQPENPIYENCRLIKNADGASYYIYKYIPDEGSTVTSITLPSSYQNTPITRIAANAFDSVKDTLVSIVIPEGYTELSDSLFNEFTNLESASLPTTLTSISNRLFYHCSRLTEFTIPESITTIGEYAFYSCRGLSSITIPSSVKEIQSMAFSDCQFVSVNFNEGLEIIGSNAFSNQQITSLELPEGLKSIGANAFRHCYNLESATLPASLEYIEASPFTDCKKLTALTIKSDKYILENGGIYTKDKKKMIEAMPSYSGVFTIPYGVEEINDYAFWITEGITEIVLPNTVKVLGRYSLTSYDVTKIELPESITTIYHGALSELYNLVEPIKIPSTVTYIQNMAIYSYKPDTLYVNKPKGSLAGAPWGADDAEIVWLK